MIEANLERAHARDGVLTQKFFWKTNVIKSPSFDKNTLKQTNFLASNNSGAGPDEFQELFIHEILEGKPEVGYIGLLPLFKTFMEVNHFSWEDQLQIQEYLSFILDRAKGKIPTGAKYLR
eukprot:CAMPEP_0170554578 /NCGR_PEP_ID=MMETSP0211-20121228/12426_1 /TAXON_ID=311385 /ORGANISM="Pseudokeronopsis sp., Strain OXSARD2" /LENGTH=119 /DNA_ID=CAMNT_0010863741 /DNA_START=1191 /DNA_END=1550 /DNA_ORIENTATION=+